MQKFKNSFLFGAVVLVACNLISKIIGAVYRIPLLKILGSEGLGLYQLIFPIYALFLVIASSGISVSLSKFISRESAKKNQHNAKKYLQAGFVLSASVSIVLAIFFAILIPFISRYQGESQLVICYFAILPSIVICSLISTFKGYFLGKRKMLVSGGMQVLEQVFKLIFSLFCASFFAQFGMIYAVCGTILGVTISELATLVVITIVYLANKEKFKIKKTSKLLKQNIVANKSMYEHKILFAKENRNIDFKMALKRIFKFGIFVSMEACIMPLTGAIDSLLVVPLLLKCGLSNVVAYTLFGLEDGIVASLIAMPTVFATSFGASLIPNLKVENTEKTTKDISEGFKLVWLICVASCFAFMFFSNDIVSFLYAGGLSDKVVYELKIVSDLIKLNAFNIIYLSLLNLSTSILQGLGDSKTPVLNMLGSVVVRIIVLAVCLSSQTINIYGVAIADMVFFALAFILNLRKIKQKVKLNYGISKFFVLPALSGVVMCLTMKLFKTLLGGLLSARYTTLIMGISGIAIYVAILFVTKVLDFKAIANMIFKKNKSSLRTSKSN